MGVNDMKTDAQAQKTTAMVVDDDVYSRDLMRKTLGALGFTTVHVAHDGSDGLRVLDKLAVQPDLLICDIFMPDKDGVEFVAALAERQYRGGLILVSGGGDHMLSLAHQIAAESGLNVLGAFAKPLCEEELRRALLGGG